MRTAGWSRRAKAAGLPGHRSPAGAGPIHHAGEETAQFLPRNGLGEPWGWKSWCGCNGSVQRESSLL